MVAPWYFKAFRDFPRPCGPVWLQGSAGRAVRRARTSVGERPWPMKISIGIIAAVLVVAAASLASSVFAPLALALFIIALVWPVQSWLQARISKLPALAVTIVMTLAVGLALASMAAWGFG